MSYATTPDATILTKTVTSVTTPAHSKSKDWGAVERVVYNFISRHYKPLRHAAKLLAVDADVLSVGTSRAWLDGRSVPGRDALLALCAVNIELEDELRALCAAKRARIAAQRGSN